MTPPDRCTAPIRGHRGDSPAAVNRCPVHGARGARPAVPPPTLTQPASTEPARPVDQALDPNTSPQRLSELYHAAIAKPVNEAVVNAVAANPSTPPEVFAHIREHGRFSTLSRVASNPGADPDTLARLARGRDPLIRQSVARNPATPASELVRIAHLSETREDRLAQMAVSRNTSAPSEALVAALASALDADPYDELAPLSRDVLSAVAQHPHTPVKHLRRLAEGADSVAAAAMRNPALPAEILRAIREDSGVGWERRTELATTAESFRAAQHAGVDTDNDEAAQVLLSMRWWELDPQSPELCLVRALYPRAADVSS